LYLLIESGFDRSLRWYGWSLSATIRHRAFTMAVLLLLR